MKNLINHKSIITCLTLTTPGLLWAAGTKQPHPIYTWLLDNVIFILAATIMLGVLASIWNLTNAVMVSKKREYLKAHGIEPTPAKAESSETFISRWYKKAWNLVPIEKEADIQLDHDYDGIKELDNSLPPWWLYGFYLSIAVAAVYLYVYQFSDIGLSQHEEYVIEMKEGERQKAAYEARQVNKIDEKNLIALLDPKALSVGEQAFQISCAACHRQDGGGSVGPNLTDKYWIHGGSIGEIYQTIKNGVPEKGMIAWKAQLQPSTIHKIASYIKTLEGTNPPDPKAPQGDLYEGETADLGVVDDK